MAWVVVTFCDALVTCETLGVDGKTSFGVDEKISFGVDGITSFVVDGKTSLVEKEVACVVFVAIVEASNQINF